MGDTQQYPFQYYNDEYFVSYPEYYVSRQLSADEYWYDRELHRFEYFHKFICDDLKLEDDLYNDLEKDGEVNSEALDLFIYRTLLSTSLSLEEGAEEYGISDVYDGLIRAPSDIVHSVMDSRPDRIQHKSGKDPWQESDKKKNRRKSIENFIVEGSVNDKNSNPTISMTLKDYRCMMKAELESKVRYIQDFYLYQWNDLKDDRTNMYKNVVLLKEDIMKYKQDNVALSVEIAKLKSKLRDTEEEINNLKVAKKKKRAQAKQRRAESKRASKSEGQLCKENEEPKDAERSENADSAEEVEITR